jgi:hypothetical protein
MPHGPSCTPSSAASAHQYVAVLRVAGHQRTRHNSHDVALQAAHRQAHRPLSGSSWWQLTTRHAAVQALCDCNMSVCWRQQQCMTWSCTQPCMHTCRVRAMHACIQGLLMRGISYTRIWRPAPTTSSFIVMPRRHRSSADAGEAATLHRNRGEQDSIVLPHSSNPRMPPHHGATIPYRRAARYAGHVMHPGKDILSPGLQCVALNACVPLLTCRCTIVTNHT